VLEHRKSRIECTSARAPQPMIEHNLTLKRTINGKARSHSGYDRTHFQKLKKSAASPIMEVALEFIFMISRVSKCF
jgi:hypothetical protein